MYTVYGKKWCVYCERSKKLLEEKKIPYEFYDIEENQEAYDWMMENNRGMKTVPVIFEDDNLIGGFDNLRDKIK